MNKAILKTVEAYLLTNKEYLSETEVEGLETQILHLKNRIYVEQLKTFKNHMSACFDAFMGDTCTNETVDMFYRSEFEIKWRGKTVTLANGAEVFQGIEEIVQSEIEDCGEV